MSEVDNTKVICPACCNQFRAIPVQVQRLMLDAGFEPPFLEPAHPPAALPEPVAYIYRTVNGLQALCYADDKRDGVEGSFIPLYLHPPARPALPGGGLAAAERLIRLRQNVGNAEYERQCEDWLNLAEGRR